MAKRQKRKARLSDDERRRRFACPPRSGAFDGIELSFLDRADPDDRHFLILAEHPEFAQAIQRGEEEIELHGEPVNPRLHITMHEIIATQLWEDQPPEAWSTARRLLDAGYERHEVLHMLASAMAGEVWQVLSAGESSDPGEYARRLQELPESWHRLAEPD